MVMKLGKILKPLPLTLITVVERGGGHEFKTQFKPVGEGKTLYWYFALMTTLAKFFWGSQ